MKIGSQCPLCNGNGKVEQRSGAIQICPGCDGSGRREPAYNRIPMTYVFGDASLIVLTPSAGAGVASTSPSRATLNIGGDYEFELVSLVAVSNPGGTAGAWQDQLQDPTYSWQPQGISIQSAARWGSIQWPNELKPRIVLPRNGQMTGIFADMSGAANSIQPCFVGYDLHPIIVPGV